MVMLLRKNFSGLLTGWAGVFLLVFGLLLVPASVARAQSSETDLAVTTADVDIDSFLLETTADTNRAVEANKLHVVLLVNGTDKNIGLTCQHDIQAMRLVLRSAFARDSRRLVIHDLTTRNRK